ncbi:MAG: phosphoenolpyruvate carboxykinase, partial [Nitrospirales bacterium]|nr:phosphoenolpyruvate carboxykinase [Nitrospirales bacterium]
MSPLKKPYAITRGKVIFDYSAMYCDTPEKLLRSELFTEILDHFIERIASKGNSLFAFLKEKMPDKRMDEMTTSMTTLFRLLASHTAEEITSMSREMGSLLTEKEKLFEFIEEFYNYWRRFERFIYLEAPKRPKKTKASLHHAQFIKSNEEFKNLVLYVYRRISENLIGQNPRVYRQLPAGANMGVFIEKADWDCPEMFSALKEIPFIRLSLIEPPVILYPKMNKRKGKFEEIHEITPEMIALSPHEWFCFPAKVGDLTAFIYFHQDFISLGLSLCNLFEIADYDSIAGKKPDVMLLFGLTGNALPGQSVFYEDKQSGTLVGLITHSEEVDYFGYFKKMTLTLHNIAMLKRNRLPVHGAMVSIKLKEGGLSNVVIIGDSGAGKSETIEALRSLADEHICEMRIIFDDMGSLALAADGTLLGYGTEIGAFVRLDDLQQGYAFGQMDRAIIMSPNRVNARVVLPVTTLEDVLQGYPVDLLL